MKRLLIVYNSRSSRYADVAEEVLRPARELKGYLVGKYEVEKTDLEQNVVKLAGLLQNGDRVVAAGGDATAVIAVNAIMTSGMDVELAVLPYGNFNDLARTLRIKKFADAVEGKVRKLYPLEILVDGKHVRYATCYVTVGMMAEAVKLYDGKKMRRVLKSWWGRYVGAYWYLAGWYFKNRRKKTFVPEFRLNGALQKGRVSDYVAVNGRSMARVMRGYDDWGRAEIFRHEVGKLTSFWRLAGFMLRSMVVRVPGVETGGDKLELVEPGRIKMQAEGEMIVMDGVRKVEVMKGDKWIKVVTG